jgi:polysaccharide export outer membrane protein
MKPSCISIALASSLAMASCAGSGPEHAAMTAQPATPYRLGAQDELRVTVLGLDSATNTYRVSDTGVISVPMLGSIPVAGMTVADVQQAIETGLRTRQIVLDPKVSAQVQTYRPFFILGEVQRPGQYAYVPGMSVISAVSVAGGYTFRANTKRARIIRSGDEAPATSSATVMPGDTITIPESWF